jgi:hypothetical protein
VPLVPVDGQATAVGAAGLEPLRQDQSGRRAVSTAVIFAFVLGALLIGVPAARYERTRRARKDWVGLRAAHRSARSAFWSALGAFIGAAFGPAAAVLVLYVLYRIGRS